MPRRNMLNDIKITIKAGAAYTVAILMIVALLLICIKGLNQLNTNYLQYVGSIREIGELKAGLEKMDAYLYHYIAVPTARDNTLASIKQETDSIDQIIQTYKGRELAPEEKKILSDFDAAWSEMQRGYKEIIKVADGGNNDEVARLLAEGSYLIQARNNTLAAVRNLNDYSAGRKETNIKSGADRSVIVLLIIVVACIIFEIASWIYIQVAFINWLTKCVLMIQELGKGHLSFNRWHLNRRDEIGELTDAMDKFADNLQQNVIFNMQQISDGNINIEPAIIDNKDEIGPVLKKMVETIKNMVKEMNSLTQSAMDGKLDVRGNEQAFKGAYQEIVQGVNKTLDAVMGPINEASAILEKVSNKDMSIRMNGDYRGDHAKIKESLNLAVENLDKSLQQVAIGAEQVASASVQVSTGGQALSQGASEQASSLEEISSNLQEMSSMTKQNVLNARDAKGVADQARSSADKGVESMGRMSSAINRIKSSSDSTAKIVKTIDEIAFQTNLLALNAAVEAARAGDAGKGFAVVAEEVRNLAMRSAEAAKNTANLIEDAVKNSENGVAINAEVLKNFQDIAEKTNKVSQVVAEIAAASDQQDQGISEVNKAVEQLNQVTQQNAANAEESASAAEEMSSQSEEMRSMVAGFRLTASSEFNQVRIGGQSRHLLHNIAGKKGSKAISGLQPDPRKVIPLDSKDSSILSTF